MAGASAAFRGFSDHLVTVSFQTVIWVRHGTPLSLPMEASGTFQLHMVLEAAASVLQHFSSLWHIQLV